MHNYSFYKRRFNVHIHSFINAEPLEKSDAPLPCQTRPGHEGKESCQRSEHRYIEINILSCSGQFGLLER